jgi:hypothetical protein
LIAPAAEGGGFTVIAAVVVAVHVFAAVPVTVYVVVDTGVNAAPFVMPPLHV